MCSFAVQGICADQVSDITYDERVFIVAEHLRLGGQVLGYGHSSTPESICLLYDWALASRMWESVMTAQADILE